MPESFGESDSIRQHYCLNFALRSIKVSSIFNLAMLYVVFSTDAVPNGISVTRGTVIEPPDAGT
jgi:hypothetical protein